MTKPPIKFEPIPEEEIETEKRWSTRFWFPKNHRSQWQLQDEEYIKLRKYLIDFYTTKSEETLLYWLKDGNEDGDLPITINYLSFGPTYCCCGVICERPEFGGEILIDGKKYEYSGSVYRERWCEAEDHQGSDKKASNEEMLEQIKCKDFLFKLNMEDGPFPFYHIYTKLKYFRE